MAGATQPNSPPSRKHSGSAWPTRPWAGYTRSLSRGHTLIHGPTTKCSRGSRCIGSRAGPAASVQIYYELAQAGQVVSFPKTTVPVGLSYFPKDLVQFPRAKVMFESEHEVGGHFAAYEQPEALVSDLRKMFGKSGHAAGVVPGYTPDIDRVERKSWDGPRTS